MEKVADRYGSLRSPFTSADVPVGTVLSRQPLTYEPGMKVPLRDRLISQEGTEGGGTPAGSG